MSPRTDPPAGGIRQLELLTADELLDRVWGSASDTGPSAVRTVITRLRRKLEPYGVDGFIVTVHGLGYRFEPANSDL